MRIGKLCGLACIAGALCRGQDFCGIAKLRATTEAAAALDRIVAVVGFDPGTILLYASSDTSVRQKGGAMSLACNISTGTERWIVYDPDSIKGSVARDFVFAHETAHHTNFQPLLPGTWSKNQELQADYYGAEYLTRLHWTGKRLLEALNELKLPQGSQQGYPTLEERQASIQKGYADELARRGDVSGDDVPQIASAPQHDSADVFRQLIAVDSSEVAKLRLVAADKVESASEFSATGAVFPILHYGVPVISPADGLVVDIQVSLGDNVMMGELLFKVQSPDIANALATYKKAANEEKLTGQAYQRAQDEFAHGTISQSALDAAKDKVEDSNANLAGAEEQLKRLGIDKDHPPRGVNVYAPISGVFLVQSWNNSTGTSMNLSGQPTAFKIADLSTVWIVCDVHENDIPKLQLGQETLVKLNAYPGRPLTGSISDIGSIIDPSGHTAKVRIEIANPGFLLLGMSGSATFTSRDKETHAVVPADAVIHLDDRDWVYVPAGGNRFKRTEIRIGKMLEGKRQEILSGLEPGQQVVINAQLLETVGN